MKKNSYQQMKRDSMNSAIVSTTSEDHHNPKPAESPFNNKAPRNHYSKNQPQQYDRNRRNTVGNYFTLGNMNSEDPNNNFIRELNEYIHQFKHKISATQTTENSPTSSLMLRTSLIQQDQEDKAVLVSPDQLNKVLADIQEQREFNRRMVSKVMQMCQSLDERDQELDRLQKTVSRMIDGRGRDTRKQRHTSYEASQHKENLNHTNHHYQYSKTNGKEQLRANLPSHKKLAQSRAKENTHAFNLSNDRQARQSSFNKYSIKDFLRLNSENLSNSSLLQQINVNGCETMGMRHHSKAKKVMASNLADDQLPTQELQRFISKSMGLRPQKYNSYV